MLERLNATLAGRYTVERELGRGGMASVWLARDLRHERPVAIKVLRAELAGAIGVDRFLREIRLTAALQHPHIVPVLDSGLVEDGEGNRLPWYVMPYVAGESLREQLRREGYLPVEQALEIAERAAGALAAAHRLGVVHRDIKPENLLLAGGEVYVADFGIAKALINTGGEQLTSTGLALGTPAYMSPEQAMGQPVDGRTDQYSLAGVLYEMLAGEPPFTGPTAQAVVARRLAEPVRPLRAVRSTVPAGTEAAILRALERIPADRFPDIATFAGALRQQVERRESPARGRTPRIAAVVGAGLLLLLLGVAGWPFVATRGRASPARDPEVVALYRRGIRGYDQRTAEGVRDAISALEAAVHRDSTYVEAWSALARAYVRAYERGFIFGAERDSGLRRAVAAADRSLAGDRPTADAWVTRAIVSRDVDPTDVAPAIRAARQALALDPRNTLAWHFLAISQAESGKMDSALAGWRRTVVIDPGYTQGLAFLALQHYRGRRYDSAAVWADSAVAVDPTYLLARTVTGDVAIERGDFARARAAIDAARRLSTEVEVVNALAQSAELEARAGAEARAREILRRADSLGAGYSPTPLHTALYLAIAHASVGDAAGAVGWLRRYAPTEDLHFQLHLRCDPPLDRLRGDSGFRAILDTTVPGGCS
jgi:tetratricopeptide (TPR) repeat protein